MSSTIKLFKKFFKRTKNKGDKRDDVECDSVPSANQDNLPAPIPIPQDSVLTVLNNHQRVEPATIQVNLPTPNSSLDGYENQSSLTSSYQSASSPTHSGHSSTAPFIQLSVANSHGFHIGDVQNVHVSNGSVVNFNSATPVVGLSSIEKTLKNLQPADDKIFDLLIKDYSKIKDWELSLISECLSDAWMALGQHLEIPNSDLSAIEEKNSNSSTAAAAEMLNFYIKTFPDTSYGFLLHSLHEIGQNKAVTQLLKLRS